MEQIQHKFNRLFNAPPVLTGTSAELRPVDRSYAAEFGEESWDERLWRGTTMSMDDAETCRAWWEGVLAARRNRTRLTFVTFDRTTGRPAGSSSYSNFSVKDRRLEIGGTWILPRYWGTGINTEAKLLMLDFAFSQLEMLRVEFKTDLLNARSRKALQNLGAVEEGILRSHTLMWDGRRRDTVYYSILGDEWPNIRQKIRNRLSK